MPEPGRQNLWAIADRIVADWPGCFEDKVGEVLIGSGSESLSMQLENRVENVNRGQIPSGRNAKKRPAPDSSTDENAGSLNDGNELDERIVDKYGYVDGCPKMPPGETVKNLEEQRQTLVIMHVKNEIHGRHEKQIRELMAETYFAQRKLINEGKTPISDIKGAFPFLFTEIGLRGHFERIVGLELDALSKTL